MEDFETNDLFEETNEIETIKKEAEMEQAMYDLKIKLANENYEMIVDKGVDVVAMKRSGHDTTTLENTLTLMLDLFVELEEYEKCAKIKDILEQI
jgi:hypothetical protein